MMSDTQQWDDEHIVTELMRRYAKDSKAIVFYRALLPFIGEIRDDLRAPLVQPPPDYLATLEACVMDSLALQGQGLMTADEYARWQAECAPVLAWLQTERDEG
jgi:hypothetical protein